MGRCLTLAIEPEKSRRRVSARVANNIFHSVEAVGEAKIEAEITGWIKGLSQPTA